MVTLQPSPTKAFTLSGVIDRNNHPWSYNNSKKSLMEQYNKLNNKSFMGNVDVESYIIHSEPSSNRDMGGISLSRFDKLHYDIQQNMNYPFNFPRGGMNSRDTDLYDHRLLKQRII